MPQTEHIDVAYVAHLARMHLSADEVSTFQGQLEQVVAYVTQLGELDLEGVEPTAHVVPLENVLREDGARESLSRDVVLENAPQTDGEQFVVPKIVE